MAEASIQAAINNVVRNVGSNNTKAAYTTWLEIYGQAVSDPFNNQVFDQRTVTNWIYPSLEVKDGLPAGALDNQETQAVIDIVFRTLSAVDAAEAAGRISAAQEQMVLDQYNVAFP